MATYSAYRAKHATLTATTVDVVTLTSAPKEIEIRNRDSTNAIYFRTDGTAPTVAGDDTFYLEPGELLVVPSNDTTPDSVRLISAGAAAYTVTAVPR